jgi:CelD/BcsL family acetyltransferase involved in cellulose biosynthesis
MDPSPSAADTTVRSENLAQLYTYYNDPACALKWEHVFSLPVWLEEWWRAFGETGRPEILSVQYQDELIGIAPLQIDGMRASFLGSADVCDYLDFVVAPGKESIFFNAIVNYLISTDVDELELRCLRPESLAIKNLLPIIEDRSIAFHREPDGISLELDLPETWEGYLGGLKSKQRHEVRRKLRRLDEAGDIRFAVYDEPGDIIDKREIFFKLFQDSRKDKTEFMTPKMKSFFSAMISAMADAGILKMGMMYVDALPAGAVLYFDYQGRIYLYNNGYDPRFATVSVGVLSKILLLQHGIDEKKKIFDFLKGQETYKYRLGGNEVQLSRLNIRLK